MSTITKDLGAVTAYAYAKEKGYTGTEAEFAELMASYATVAEQASQSAQTATEKAQQASASATSASQSADTASASAQTAQTAQQTASTKASEAQQSATTATTKAQEASQSASESSQSASTAVQAKQDAQIAKTASETAQASAESARDDAESARDEAQQSVSGISGKVEQIDQNTADIASLEADRYKAYVTDITSGAVASFPDGADNIPMKDVTVQIEPVQDLSHGDPSPDNICPISGWTGCEVQRARKNLLYQAPTSTSVINGVTWTVNADGSISARGTASDNSTFNYIDINVNTDIKFNGNYKYIQFPFVPITILKIGVKFGKFDKWVTLYSNVITDINEVADKITQFWFQIKSGQTADITFYPMIYNANDATPESWSPYSGNTYPITFPVEAGTVYGGTLDVTKGELVVDRAEIASYNGEALASTWISDRDVYTSGTTPTIGAQVVYKLATPIHYPLTPNQINSLYGQNNVWADTGDTEVAYRADTQKYIQKKIVEAVSALS